MRINLDAANKSQRLTYDRNMVVENWRNKPSSAAEDLASLIFQPDFELVEADDGSIDSKKEEIRIRGHFNGVDTTQAKFQSNLIVKRKTIVKSMSRQRISSKLINLGQPNEIRAINGQVFEFIWNNETLEHSDEFLIKYKIDLYGNDKIKIPTQHANFEWLEQWL